MVVPGLEHGSNPTPSASRRGPLIATGAVQGWDRATRELPAELAEEIDFAFENLGAVLVASGAGFGDVVQVDVFAGVDGVRPLLNTAWVRWFPDESSRPARHLIRHELPAGMRIQLKALAYVDADEKGNAK